MFYDSILFGNAKTNIFNNPPTVNSVTIQNTSFDNPLSVSPTIALNPKRPRSLMDPSGETPYTQQWSADFQRDLGTGFLLDLGYFASKGDSPYRCPRHQPTSSVQLSRFTALHCNGDHKLHCTGCVCHRSDNSVIKPHPSIPWLRRHRRHSVFVQLQLSLATSSTSKTLPRQLVAEFCVHVVSQPHRQPDRSQHGSANSRDIAAEYGPSQQDRRHIFTMNWVYDLPFFRQQSGFTGHVLGGWVF